MSYSQYLEKTMLELLKSLVFAVIMVPVVMAIILGAIYGLVKCSTSFRTLVTKTRLKSSIDSPQNARRVRAFCSQDFPVYADII
jgi:hypothetical protein